jgi:hypothetical protein
VGLLHAPDRTARSAKRGSIPRFFKLFIILLPPGQKAGIVQRNTPAPVVYSGRRHTMRRENTGESAERKGKSGTYSAKLLYI